MKTSAQGQSFLDSLFPPVSLYLEQSLGSSKASTDICGVNEQMTEPPNTRVMGGGGRWGSRPTEGRADARHPSHGVHLWAETQGELLRYCLSL